MIVFSSVNKQFLPNSFALKDISFEIASGELVLLTGPSGSGKTSLMKLLTKEYQPTSGDIVFHEVNLNDIKNSQIHLHRRKIGVVFQDYNLIPELNIWENIALPLSIMGKKESEIEQRVTDLLELVSLTDKALHFPKQLSGGEAQRISIARALSTGPAVIFADEPTGNLDRENSIQIAKLLEKINSFGTTILFSTHDHDVIDLMSGHRHIILNNGLLEKDSGQSKKTKKDIPEKSESDSQKTKTTQESKTETQTKTTEVEEVQTEEKTPPQGGFFAKLFKQKKEEPVTLDEETRDSDSKKTSVSSEINETNEELEETKEEEKEKIDSKTTKIKKNKNSTKEKSKKKST